MTLPEYSSDTKAAEILAAAERLFSQHGFDGVSMNQVATEARVSKANVFHHFGSKEDLYVAVLQQVNMELGRTTVAIMNASDAPIEERIAQFARAHLEHLLSNEERTRIFMRECLENRPGRGKTLAEKVYGKNFTELIRPIEEAQRQGKVRADASPTMLVTMLVASNVFFVQNREALRHLPGADACVTDPNLFIKHLVANLMLGIATKPTA